MKILIIQTAFTGDVVLATPIIEKLHHDFPEAQLDFLVRKGNESLLENHPYLNKVLVFDKKTHKYRNLFNLIKNIRAENYDYVLNAQRFFTSGLITVLSKAKTKIGFDKNPFSKYFSKSVRHIIGNKDHYTHEVERNLALVSDIADKQFAKPKLHIGAKEEAIIAPYLKPYYICIAPSSVWFTKQFPAEKWIAFIKALDEKYTVYLLGGKDDEAVCNEIVKATTNLKDNALTGMNIISLTGKLSFLASAALMKHATMSYVNDSAPMHLASAVNAPVAAIFCSTIPDFGFGPLSDSSHLLETKLNLDCRPCNLHGRKACPKGHFKCAEIEVEDMIKILGG